MDAFVDDKFVWCGLRDGKVTAISIEEGKDLLDTKKEWIRSGVEEIVKMNHEKAFEEFNEFLSEKEGQKS